MLVLSTDFETSCREFARLVRGAKRDIYYSTFLCDLSHLLPGLQGETVKSLFTAACRRGVKIHILYNPEMSYGGLEPEQFARELPPSVEVRAVYGSGHLHPVTKLFVDNTRYSNHHQKYLCVDGKQMMVCGTDIDSDRAPWMTNNPSGYMWHETSVSLPCSSEMYQFVQRNHNEICPPPFPLLNAMPEHDLMIQMIRNSETSIHLEHQIFLSTAGTQNVVLEEVVRRLAQAYRQHEQFHVLILTNTSQVDECKPVDWFTRQCAYHSKKHMEDTAGQLEIPDDFYAKHLKLCTLQHPERGHIKVHSNVLIVDNKHLIRTSSNLSDRSFSDKPCDTELGVYVDLEPAVNDFQQQLFLNYTSLSRVVPEVLTVQWMVENDVPVFRAIDSNPVIPPAVMDNFIEQKVFGGVEEVTWDNAVVDRDVVNPDPFPVRQVVWGSLLLVGLVGVLAAVKRN